MMTTRNQTSLVALVCLMSACTAAPSTSSTEDAQLEGIDAKEDAAGEELLPLTIGVNPTGIEDPTLYQALEEGDELNIEFGFQGLWMVVLALRIDEPVSGLAEISARVQTADETIGEFAIPKQLIVPAEDGFYYYLNLFLVVAGPEYAGEEAWVTLKVVDKEGLSFGSTLQVRLSGGNLPSGGDDAPPALFPDADEEAIEDVAGNPDQDAQSAGPFSDAP